jgi:hypothetical protein
MDRLSTGEWLEVKGEDVLSASKWKKKRFERFKEV